MCVEKKKGTETGASDLKFCFIFQVGTQIWRRLIHKISAKIIQTIISNFKWSRCLSNRWTPGLCLPSSHVLWLCPSCCLSKIFAHSYVRKWQCQLTSENCIVQKSCEFISLKFEHRLGKRNEISSLKLTSQCQFFFHKNWTGLKIMRGTKAAS